MQAVSFGLVQVPTPGTPVQITSDTTMKATMLMVRTVPGFTGKTYLGLAGLNKNAAAKPGVLRVFSEPGFGPQDGEVLPPASRGHGNVLSVFDYWIDADVANEGLIVTCFIA